MVRVRFEAIGTLPAREFEVNMALLRYPREPDAMAEFEAETTKAELPAGTLVEVQMPSGTQPRWSWWPGVVQVYSDQFASRGKVTVALDASSDCTQRQVSVSRSSLRVVLPAGSRLRVEGAGVPGVDGVYEPVGFHDGVPRFECRNMTILRCAMPSGNTGASFFLHHAPLMDHSFLNSRMRFDRWPLSSLLCLFSQRQQVQG